MDVITCVAPNLRTIPHNRVNPNAGKKADTSYQELKKNCTGVEIQKILRWWLQIRQRYCFWEHSDVEPFGIPESWWQSYSRNSQKNIVDVLM